MTINTITITTIPSADIYWALTTWVTLSKCLPCIFLLNSHCVLLIFCIRKLWHWKVNELAQCHTVNIRFEPGFLALETRELVALVTSKPILLLDPVFSFLQGCCHEAWVSVDVGAFSVNDTNRNSYSHSFDNWSVRLRAYNPYPPPALIARGLEHSRIIFLSGFNPPF